MVAATASDDREAIEFLRNLAAAGDDAFDEECIVGLIAQLSDEDGALVAAIARRAGGQGDPQLSPKVTPSVISWPPAPSTQQRQRADSPAVGTTRTRCGAA